MARTPTQATKSAAQSLAARIVRAPYAYDPEEAAARYQDLLAAASGLKSLTTSHPPLKDLLTGIADGSSYLWQLITADPARLIALLNAEPEAARDATLQDAHAAAEADDEAELMRQLRQAKQRCALLAALADIGGVWDVPEVTAFLAAMADAAVSAALRYYLRQAVNEGKWLGSPKNLEEGCGLILLAMGKHGAGELNYSSDIDLIAFYDPEIAPLAEHVEPAPFFVKLVQRISRVVQERTMDGYVFRVDLRLRPDPGSTAVAISYNAALSYYEDVGQNWERAALLKARPCAGDKAAGESLLKELAPFIWRKYLDYAAIADVHAMKRQIHAHRGHGQIAVEGHNVKLGRGGIREIEFFVQTQQLVAGGRNPILRVRGTEEGLRILAQEGWIGEKVAEELKTSYRFLRTIEHRLQMVADEQTHTLPDDKDGMERFARFAGYKNRAAFAAEITRHMETVQRHYARLFEDAPPLAAAVGSLVFTGDEDDPETLLTLGNMGFDDPSQVSGTVRGWHHGRYAATRTPRARELLTELLPALLDAFARTSGPSAALRAFDRVLSQLPAGVEFLALLRSNPGFLSLLADALGSAPRLADAVARRPHVLDAVLEPAFFAEVPDRETLSRRLEHTLKEALDYEDLLNRARIFGQEQMVLIGVRVLSGALGPDRAGAVFARAADMLVARLLDAAYQDLTQAHGTIEGAEFTVLAMGKLGGREMTAASDLDIILLYDHPEHVAESNGRRPIAPSQFFSRLTQRLISALAAPTSEGVLYEVDVRLRPSGRSGPLATHLAAFEEYQRKEAWTWEHMALTRARPIGGSEAMRKRVEEAISAILQQPRDTAKIAKDVREMRQTLAKEKGDKKPWELKYAAGGLIDVEFIAQFLQLIHAHEHPQILHPTTSQVLDRAHQAGVLSQDDREILRPAVDLYHNITQILRLCLAGAFEPENSDKGLCALLARSANMADFKALDSELKSVQKQVAAVSKRLY